METGIYNISIDQYHSGAGVSRSGIREFRRSPLHYWHEYLNHEKPIDERLEIIGKASSTQKSNSLYFGNAFHTYLLEPEQFEKLYFVTDKPNRQSNAGKAEFALVLERAEGRQLIETEAMNEIIQMHRSVMNHPTARNLIEGAVYEKSLFWRDKGSNLLCKARPDIWHSNMVVDIKTTKDASPKAFQRDVYNYDYHIQAGMIHEGLFELQGINMMNFIYITVEKEAPFAVGVYTLDEQSVLKGIEEFRKTAVEMQECFMTDSWPSYANSVISLPAYAYSNQGDL